MRECIVCQSFLSNDLFLRVKHEKAENRNYSLEELLEQNRNNALFMVVHHTWVLDVWKNYITEIRDSDTNKNIPTVEIHLNQQVAKWILEHRSILENIIQKESYAGEYIRIHQPHHEKMEQAVREDVLNPHHFFSQLSLPVATSGLPACIARNTTIVS